MPIILGGQLLPGSTPDILSTSGAPTAGSDEVQTITFGGTPTGGTFKLTFAGHTTAAITWSATNTTLRDNVDAALEALPPIGTGGVTTAVGTMTAGIGTLTVTFAGTRVAKKTHSVMTVADNSLTGTAPTVSVAQTTPGVEATHRSAPTGTLLVRTDTGVLHANTSATANAPTWTAQT
jgi:hypothetical protein